ncbi:MAG: PrsW family glutamic-type intramembrane protease [Aggregatilineales bacterium]
MTYTTRYITPPQEDQEIYPYRRVWPSLGLENGIFFAVTASIFFAVNFLSFSLPETFVRPLNLALALLPLGLWLLFSYRAEFRVPQPRERLLAVLIISALAANAIGIPLLNDFFQVERWVPLGDNSERILGYTFTVGAVQEIIKYLVIRYLTWPRLFRTRADSIAYGAASAIGYGTVENLHFVFSGAALPDYAAIYIFDTIAVNLAGSIIVAYGLSETRFSNASPFLLPFMVFLASLTTGTVVTLRAGLINASFTLQGAFARPLLGFLFSVGVLLAASVVFIFLFENSERRAREAAAAQGD